MAEMEFSQGEPDLFKIETNNDVLTAKNLPIYFFQEIEADLCNNLLRSSSPENYQSDGAIDFIEDIVDKVKEEFEGLVQDEDRKTSLKSLSKIFTILLSVKAGITEKIIKIVRFALSAVLKIWSGQN